MLLLVLSAWRGDCRRRHYWWLRDSEGGLVGFADAAACAQDVLDGAMNVGCGHTCCAACLLETIRRSPVRSAALCAGFGFADVNAVGGSRNGRVTVRCAACRLRP